jgi:AraC-like DNA-binding protein
MSLAVLSTDQVPARESKGYWGELVSRAFGRLQSDTYGDEDFHGRVTHVAAGDVQVGTLQASRHRVVRTAARRGASDPGHLKLVVQRAGRCLFEQDGRRAWLKPGDWSLYDTTRSYIVSAPQAVDLHVLMLPREAVLKGRQDLADLLVRRLRGGSGFARVACGTVGRVLDAARAGAMPHAAAGAEIAELVHLALVEQSGARVEPLRRSLLRERIKAFIAERLPDPALDVDMIAAALGCSLRSVHNAFELEDCSVRQYIWESRLAAVRAELDRGVAGCRSITETAFAWGFTSAAHFSRAFRAVYGVSAREWRSGLRPTSDAAAA